MQKVVMCLFVVGLLLPGLARAQLEIDITRGNVEPLPIAVPDFTGLSELADRRGEAVMRGAEMAQVIANDLVSSGLFRAVAPEAFIEDKPSVDGRPRFPDWRAIGAQALVVGQVTYLSDGRLQATFRLWDVFGGSQMIGVRFHTTPDNWRQIAHRIADAIYKRLTGEDGYFDSRIVFVAESGPARRRVKQLAIMDQDGANLRVLTDGSFEALTPRFSPTQQEITYLSYENRRPRVYMMDMDTGKREQLGTFEGMTFAPRFSPDGNKVVMSLARDGNSEIYVMDLRTRQMVRLTNDPGIDTSPTFSPDGRRIVFNSDRGGKSQLYVMNADGTDVQRISFGEGRFFTPVWSPRGDLIAFTRQYRGQFAIGVMRPDGSGERILSEGYHAEGPTWAPNGRIILFFKSDRFDRRGNQRTRIWSVDVTGRNEKEVSTPMDASDPAWSPLNK